MFLCCLRLCRVWRLISTRVCRLRSIFMIPGWAKLLMFYTVEWEMFFFFNWDSLLGVIRDVWLFVTRWWTGWRLDYLGARVASFFWWSFGSKSVLSVRILEKSLGLHEDLFACERSMGVRGSGSWGGLTWLF
jgi:hypothetical protein